jgi:hypothetical protein
MHEHLQEVARPQNNPHMSEKSLGLIGNAPAQKSWGVAEWRSPEHFR